MVLHGLLFLMPNHTKRKIVKKCTSVIHQEQLNGSQSKNYNVFIIDEGTSTITAQLHTRHVEK